MRVAEFALLVVPNDYKADVARPGGVAVEDGRYGGFVSVRRGCALSMAFGRQHNADFNSLPIGRGRLQIPEY